jgi:hypothetical protein
MFRSVIIKWTYSIHGRSTLGDYRNDDFRLHRRIGTFLLAYFSLQKRPGMEIRHYPFLLSTCCSLWILVVGLSFGLQVGRIKLRRDI